jgi:hypothetical protein
MIRLGASVNGVFVIPRLGDQVLPAAMRWPAVRHLAVVDWNKNAVFANLDRQRFPDVERIYFLSPHPCEHSVLFRFLPATEFRWMLPRAGHHRWFRNLEPQHLGYIGQSMEQRLRTEAAAMPTPKVERAVGGKWPAVINDV